MALHIRMSLRRVGILILHFFLEAFKRLYTYVAMWSCWTG
jgi:hypothetical protein